MGGQLSAIHKFRPGARDDGDADRRHQGAGLYRYHRGSRAFRRADARPATACCSSYLRHTSASLVIQENADPDVQTDLVTALEKMAPDNAPWVHKVEGPDDMPAHVKAMLTGVSLHVPVNLGRLWLGTWQGIYLVEHRTKPHQREVVLQFIGSRASD